MQHVFSSKRVRKLARSLAAGAPPTDPNPLYLLRLLVAIAEAGFVPGVLLYLTYWFPQSYRARANAWLMIGMPATIMIASPLSGLVLDMDGALGLAGWQWLFLLEAMPSLILGIVTYFHLTDRPAQASWLTPSECEVLQQTLDREQRPAGAKPNQSVWSEIRSRKVMLLTLAYFCIVTTLNTNAVWAPRIIREVFAGTTTLSYIGFLAAIAPFFTVIAMPIWSARSDQRNERTWHKAIPMGLAAIGWLTITVSDIGWVRIFCLILVSVGAFTALAVFWALTAPLLSTKNRPTSITLQ